jgi:hypothetical protein
MDTVTDIIGKTYRDGPTSCLPQNAKQSSFTAVFGTDGHASAYQTQGVPPNPYKLLRR